MRAFVYGTLTHRPVLETVLGHTVPLRRRAVLHNHARFALVDEIYPGVIWEAGASVEGLVFDVSAEDVRILDDFEGEEYIRKAVTVDLLDTSDINEDITGIEANVYIYIGNTEKLKGAWSPRAFATSTGHDKEVVQHLWER